PLAIGATVYTAFLFAQAEGRDLWQSSILPVHLLVQAAMMGAGALVIIRPGHGVGMAVLGGALVVDLLVTLGGEFGIPHASDVAATAAHMITRGRYKRYWQGSLWLGHVGPLALLGLGAVVGEPALAIPAAVFAAIGLYLYEYAFVMAPQEVPNS
ncbi:MAG: 4Fe-4S ferredoxin, partial [Myxococcota bacterium]|nr:4Fe-4S ferredoxin [Myxococcota bacterium]